MNKFIKTSFSTILLAALLVMSISSCKKEFDNPPAYAPAVNMTANTTIAQLKARHTVPGAIDLIDSGSDIIIRGIVIADDKSGNFYKSIVIQDTTGGLALNINGLSLYTTYPIGTELFIKCNNLYLSDYNKQIQLGGGIQTGTTPTLADIPTSTIGKFVFRGTLNNVVVPKDVTPTQLGTTMQDKYQNTLIRLTNFEFDRADTAKTFASVGITSPSAASFDLKYCSTLSANSSLANIELRTSNYANFAGSPIPNGNGTVTAIYTLYGTYKQLAIRDTNDVKCWGARCGAGGGGTGPVTGALFSETFETYTASTTTPFAGTGWQNISTPSENATKTFISNFSSNNSTKVSAFASTQLATNAITSWLITPAISLTGATVTAPKLSFTTAARYTTGTFKVFVSTDYNSSNPPASATWTQLTATMATLPSTSFTAFIPSGSISLSAYIGQTIYIGYKYEVPAGTATSAAATWEVDNITVVPN